MSGPLTGTVITVAELHGASGAVNIPTGHKLVAVDVGGFVAPGMVIQTQYTRVDTQAVYSYTSASGSAYDAMNITALVATFTPKYATSKILISIMVSGDTNDADFHFAIERNGTPIGINSNGSSRWFGLAPGSNSAGIGNGNNASLWTFFYVDTPGVATPVVYQVRYQPSETGPQARTFYLNRTASASNSNFNEVGISQILIQEIAQ
jgi:hypothetical protein